MSNTFVTPRSVSTISQSRVDYNNSLLALLENFASPGAPGAGSISLEGVTGLKEGMLWYKSGSNTTLGQGRVLLYKNGQFTRDGLGVFTTASAVSANVAASNGNLVVGDLVDIGDNRLYRIHSSGQYIVDVGIPPVGYTVGNADLLDNIDSSQFLRSDTPDSFTQELTGSHMLTLSNTTATSTTVGALKLSGATGAILMDSAGQKRIIWNDGGAHFGAYSGSYYNTGVYKYTTTGDGAAQFYLTSDSSHGAIMLRVADIGTAEATPVWRQSLILSNVGMTLNSNTIWHAGNDGTSSGLDADLLDGVQLAAIQNAYAANDLVTWASAQGNDHATLLTARSNDFATWNAAQGNDHVTLLNARSNDWATWVSAQTNDHATLLTARSNDWTTWVSAQGNDHVTLLNARSNDWATWVSAQGNDHATLLTARSNDLATFTTTVHIARTNANIAYDNAVSVARSNDWATWVSAQGNDHATLLTARSNDFATWNAAQGNDHTTLLTARSNDWATWVSAQGNDHATLLSARANDHAGFISITGSFQANDWLTWGSAQGNDHVTLLSARANDFATWNAAQGNDHSTLLTARSNDWATWVSAQGNDHATLLTARSNDFTTYTSAGNDARANDWLTWGSAQGNDHATLLTARANDWLTWGSAQGNDHATLLTARSNDWATWVSAQGNDHTTLLTARSNDFATWNAAQGNDHSTLLTARSNDWATFNTLTINTFGTYSNVMALKMNANSTSLSSAVNIDTIPNGLYSWTSGGNAPTGAPFIDGLLLQSNSTGSSQEHQLVFSGTNLQIRKADSGIWGGWAKYWNDGNDGSGSGLNADLLDGADLVNNAPTVNTVVGRDVSGAINVAFAFAHGTTPGFALFETDTTTATRLITSGGTSNLEVGASGSGAVASSGNLVISGYLNSNVGSVKIRSFGADHDVMHSGQAYFYNDSSVFTSNLKIGRNSSQYLSISGNDAATYLHARSEGLGLSNFRNFRIKVANTTTDYDYVFNNEGVFKAKSIENENGTFVVGNLGAVSALSLTALSITTTVGGADLAGRLTVSSGSQVDPGVNFEGTNTGILRETTGGRLAFAHGGVRVANCNSSIFHLAPGVTLRGLDMYNTTTGSAANMFITTNGDPIRSTSSIKYKANVETMLDAYADNVIDNVRPVFYKSKSAADNPDWGYWGIIAEELHDIDPRLVHYGVNKDGSLEPEGVQYERFIPHLLNVVRRQKLQLAELRSEIETIKEKLGL